MTNTLGYLFFLHQQMTHYSTCKGIIQDTLTDVKLTKLLTINPNACLRLLPYLEDSTPDMEDNTLDNAMDDYENEGNKLVPIPFKLYCTDAGYGTCTTCVTTKVISIKCNVEYGNLLNKLLLCMKAGSYIFLSLQYVTVSFVANIGPESCMQLM